jgi:hypothetical protein
MPTQVRKGSAFGDKLAGVGNTVIPGRTPGLVGFVDAAL